VLIQLCKANRTNFLGRHYSKFRGILAFPGPRCKTPYSMRSGHPGVIIRPSFTTIFLSYRKSSVQLGFVAHLRQGMPCLACRPLRYLQIWPGRDCRASHSIGAYLRFITNFLESPKTVSSAGHNAVHWVHILRAASLEHNCLSLLCSSVAANHQSSLNGADTRLSTM
jgi:hypothetical protein